MKNEITPNFYIPKIGFGTWRIGNNHSKDSKSQNALLIALETGYVHFDTAELYANGHAEELLGQAVLSSKVKREALFITTKVLPSHLQYDQVLRACEGSLQRLQMDYIDLYLIHWPSSVMQLEDTFRALNKLVSDKKIRHIGVSNFNLKLLKQCQSLSETPILTNQVPFSLSDRSYIKNGILEYCQKSNILLTAYSPMDEGRLRSNKTLEAVAKAHNATTYQIALAWVISHPRAITIPMSANPKHIRENFAAADIELTVDEIKRLAND